MSKPIAGVLLFGMWGLYLCYLFLGLSPWPSAILAWSAALLLGPRLDKAARRSVVFCMVPDCYCYCSVGSMGFAFRPKSFSYLIWIWWRYLPLSAR